MVMDDDVESAFTSEAEISELANPVVDRAENAIEDADLQINAK
jgi:hypothetical protein